MPKMQALKGVLRTFWLMTKEDWGELDHKFYKIVFGAVMFILMGLFWFYFLRNFISFR
jgi:Mg2+ and Co2+ transporter CorA